jgi:hypothetical protein
MGYKWNIIYGIDLSAVRNRTSPDEWDNWLFYRGLEGAVVNSEELP